ncbi:histidine phosphatase family protein [Solimicrobium silvestre]|uniref:Histidine phosphatase superfamily (Branch 1) n=1 Tax=Solimicrobium silvestre TaxID=2099400 RepID=A0A2S9H4W1_9BURK|nr:histidine phosphatase family protein [Solimicrobium silvestre]PRC95022.1 Histidine phosphatase superfamily (branch 1) [Solimicrobium silvestre]
MDAIYLVRHGQASFGSANYDQLSELGVRQSLLLGQWMRQSQQSVETLVLGGMQRHHQSAEAFVEGFGSPEHLHPQHWLVEPGFNEFDHEQILHRSRPEFADSLQLMQFLASQDQPRSVFERMFSDALARWMNGENDVDYVESWSAFQTRVSCSLKALTTEKLITQNTIVFTSGGPISVACQQLLAVPDTHLMQLMVGMVNSGVSKLLHSDGQINLASMNTIAHLELHNDQSLITYR